jgi:hypothetical protein
VIAVGLPILNLLSNWVGATEALDKALAESKAYR